MRERKSILFLTNRVPFPADKGDRIRTFHEIDHLARSHDVYCACFAHNDVEMRHADAVERWCKDVIAIPSNRRSAAMRALHGWFQGQPLTQSAYDSPEMSRRLQRWSERVDFDAVVAFSSMMAPYALTIPAKRRVLDLCDVDSEKWLDYARAARWPVSSLWRAECSRLQLLERTCLRQFDATIVITERERQLIAPFADAERTFVIPNGVRIDRSDTPTPRGVGPVIGFLGTMDYAPNIEGVRWFSRHVWPRVLKELPFARFMIIGRNPTRAVRRLGRQQGVIVTGEVADARRYLARCRVVVAPLHIARGIPNKVLEAMAARRPVVCTSAVASTLRAVSGRELIVADEPAPMAEAVVDLAWHDGKCESIANGGRAYVGRHHRWAEAMERFEEVVLGESVPRRQNLPIEGLGLSEHRSVEKLARLPERIFDDADFACDEAHSQGDQARGVSQFAP